LRVFLLAAANLLKFLSSITASRLKVAVQYLKMVDQLFFKHFGEIVKHLCDVFRGRTPHRRRPLPGQSRQHVHLLFLDAVVEDDDNDDDDMYGG